MRHSRSSGMSSPGFDTGNCRGVIRTRCQSEEWTDQCSGNIHTKCCLERRRRSLINGQFCIGRATLPRFCHVSSRLTLGISFEFIGPALFESCSIVGGWTNVQAALDCRASNRRHCWFRESIWTMERYLSQQTSVSGDWVSC